MNYKGLFKALSNILKEADLSDFSFILKIFVKSHTLIDIKNSRTNASATVKFL